MPLTSLLVTPERQTFSVVLLGEFNPAIFQPLWFSYNSLVPQEEIENVDLSVVHNAVTSFEVGEISIQVNKRRFGITTVKSSQGPQVRDLAVGTISILEHTPLTSLGLNLDMIFGFDSVEEWHAFGHRLVPKSDWGLFLKSPGMTSVHVEGKRDDVPSAKISFRVEPSGDVPNGVLIATNQHYELMAPHRLDVRQRHDEAIRILNEDWVPFCAYARSAARKLLRLDPLIEETST